MPGPADRPRGHLAGEVAPLLLSVLLVALDVVSGPGIQYGGALCAVPLLAAALSGPVATGVQGLVAAGACLGLGAYEGARVDSTGPWFDHPLVRLGLILAMTALGAGVAVHRVRLERRARQLAAVADAAQQAIIGPLPPRVGALDCAGVYLSATSHARIGGDLVEVVETPFGVRALIGDVQGKGMGAVRLAGRVLGSFREAAYDRADLPALAVAMDAAVTRSAPEDVFVTATIVEVEEETGRLRVVSCGHPPPFVVDGPGSARSSAPGGAPQERADVLAVTPAPPLGMLALAGPPRVATAQLEVGQRLVLVTDGLLEARRPRRFSRSPSGPFLDAEALLATTLGRAASPATGLDGVVRGARRWARGRLRDDLAVLVLARRTAPRAVVGLGGAAGDQVGARSALDVDRAAS